MIAPIVLLPVLGAALSTALMRNRRWQRTTTVTVLTLMTALAGRLLVTVRRDGLQVEPLGGWAPEVGITLVVDITAGLFLLISVVTLLGVAIYAIAQPNEEDAFEAFHPAYMVLSAGVALAFATGDLFTLFVAFELTLVASYVLLTLGGGASQVRAGTTYITANLVASALFLLAVAGVYGAIGSVNLAVMADRWPELSGHLDTGLGLLLVSAFAIKAAAFPLFFWLPDAYPAAPTSVTAVFAGLLTKIGVYAILRVYGLLQLDQLGTTLTAVAALTMLVGVMGALAQSDIKRILSFHIVSQIGYKLVGIALFTTAGLAATVIFVVHQIPLKTALLLVGGLVEHDQGTGRLDRVSGLAVRRPLVAALFGVTALSLVGIPPFSGFAAKLSVVQAAGDAGSWWLFTVALVVGVGTLLSMAKIWTGGFWGEPTMPEGRSTAARIRPMTIATSALVAVTLVVAISMGMIVELAQEAAGGLIDPTGYISAVIG